MGEWSKSLGEKGEKITKFIFEEILGINSLEENLSIACIFGEKHKRKEAKGERKTHGLDGLFYLNSPLEDELLDIGIISSKFTNEYPNSPRSKFVSHLEDLSFAIECFQYSEDNNRISQSFNNVTKTSFTGILVWLSNTNSVDFELIPKLSKTQLSSDLQFEKIIVLDNARVNFLYETIYKTKKQRSNVQFVYHDTSLNRSYLNENSYGDNFPINYLYSDIIILRIEENQQIEFLIFVNDGFDSDNLSQILAFSKSFDHLNAVEKTTINYRIYDELEHENLVKSTLTKYSNYKLKENLIISIYGLDHKLIKIDQQYNQILKFGNIAA